MVAPNVGSPTSSVKRMKITLIGALVALTLWVIGTFVRPLGTGIVHILLVLGTTLYTSWVLTSRRRS